MKDPHRLVVFTDNHSAQLSEALKRFMLVQAHQSYDVLGG
jgi:hypothetical protein